MRAFEFLKEAENQDSKIRQTQTAITDKVNDIFDIDELNQIYSYVRKIDLGGGFEGIFDKDIDLRQVQSTLSKAIIDTKAPFEDKMGFAKEIVTTGIIDVEKLLTPAITQEFESIVTTQYPAIYQSVGPELMKISGSFKSGTTKTQKGKGEFFLAIASPQIMLSKEGKGDILINGIGYEVKDDEARIKGRKGYGTVDQAKQTVIENITKFVENQIKKNPQSPLQGKQFSAGIGARQNFWTEFAPLAIQGGAKPNDVLKFVKDQWNSIIKSLYLKISNEELASVSPFNSQGVLDFSALHAPMKALAFNYYKTADGFAGVLFVNSKKMTTTYIESAEQFVDLIGVKKYGFDTGVQNGMQVQTP